MQFLPQKAVKKQAVAVFLAEHPDPRTTTLYKDLPNEIVKVCMAQTPFKEQVWQLFFDGASRTGPKGNIVAGMGVVLVSPQNYVIPRAISLTEPCSNNVAKYNALLIGMQLAKEIGVKHLEAYRDSKLIVNQVRGEYEVRHENLVSYHNTTINMAEKFRSFYINHVPRQQNAHANALAPSSLNWLFQLERQRRYSYTAVTCTTKIRPRRQSNSRKKTSSQRGS